MLSLKSGKRVPNAPRNCAQSTFRQAAPALARAKRSSRVQKRSKKGTREKKRGEVLCAALSNEMNVQIREREGIECGRPGDVPFLLFQRGGARITSTARLKRNSKCTGNDIIAASRRAGACGILDASAEADSGLSSEAPRRAASQRGVETKQRPDAARRSKGQLRFTTESNSTPMATPWHRR